MPSKHPSYRKSSNCFLTVANPFTTYTILFLRTFQMTNLTIGINYFFDFSLQIYLYPNSIYILCICFRLCVLDIRHHIFEHACILVEEILVENEPNIYIADKSKEFGKVICFAIFIRKKIGPMILAS